MGTCERIQARSLPDLGRNVPSQIPVLGWRRLRCSIPSARVRLRKHSPLLSAPVAAYWRPNVDAGLVNGRAKGGRMKSINRKLYRAQVIPTTRSMVFMSMAPILRDIRRWWHRCAERHYLICADVEQERAREAQMNVAYYQKRAALARSAQL